MNETAAVKKLTTFASDSAMKLRLLTGPLWKFLTFSPADDLIAPRNGLCLSIERSGVSVAYGSRFLSRVSIRGVKRRPFDGPGYPQPEELASAMALTMNELDAHGADITLSVPKAWAIIRTAELPAAVKENLIEVVSYELDRLTPISAEDAFYDFDVLKENEGKLTLLIIAVKADVVAPYLDALREKGMRVSRITVNLSCIGTLCSFLEGRRNQIFVEASREGYEGALFSDGFLVGAFSERLPSADDRSVADALLSEIKSLGDALKTHGEEPGILLLLRDAAPTLRELLKVRATSGIGIKMIDEMDLKLGIPGSQQHNISYASVGGVLESLWQKSKGLNLLSKGRREKKKPPLLITSLLLVALIALWFLYIVAPFQVEGKRLAEIDRQIAMRKDEIRKVEALKKDVEALQKDISTIEEFKGNRILALNLLKELTTTLPRTTWLTRVRITDATVEIEGYASSATEMLPKLEASKFFRKAEFASPTFRDVRMNADRFIIKMEIEGVRKPEAEVIKDGKK